MFFCLVSPLLPNAGSNTAKCRMTPARGAGRALPQWLADSNAVGVTIRPRTRLSFHYVREGIARNDVSISLEKCKPGHGCCS